MLDSLLAFREQRMLQRLSEAMRGAYPVHAPGTSPITKLVAMVVVISELLGALFFGYPQTPRGQAINLNEWELVWSDEFDGESLDISKWKSCYGNIPRRGGFWDDDQSFVQDGNLIIRTEYKENGRMGSGWYTGAIETKGLFEQQYGYFEVSCICPGGVGLWAAFWMMSDGVFATPDGTANDGGEIDIFESFFYNQGRSHDAISSAVHFDGYGDAHQSVLVGHYKGRNIYTEYNTYGLEWNENELIFYVNGVETDRLTGKWVPHVAEYLLLSVEVAGQVKNINGAEVPVLDPNNNIEDNDMSIFPLDFKVDYVRVYQRKDAIA